MLTGTTPLYHNVHDNVSRRLGNSNVTLAEILKKNGFVTAAIVGSFVLDKQFGLEQGFDTYDDKVGGNIDDNASMMTKFHNERIAEDVTGIANTWLEENRNEKFFLFLHYFDPHLPFEPYKQFRFTSLPEIAFAADKYDTEIAYTDHYIGKVIDRLKLLGLYDSTLIILTGDHGESLGQHGEQEHSFFIYHSTIHVPLMFKLPRSAKTAKIDEVTGLVDIVPTICSLLGIAPPPQVQGQDLSVYFQNNQPPSPERYLYSESLSAEKRFYYAEPLHALVANRYKYIHTKRSELYDLLNDPHETDNIIKKQPEIANELHGRLMTMLGQTTNNDSENKLDLDAESLRRLQSLGYVTGNTNVSLQSDHDKADPKDLIELNRDHIILMSYVPTKTTYGPAKKLARKIIKQWPEIYVNDLTTFGALLAIDQDPEFRDSDTAIFILEHGAKVTKYQEPFILHVLATAYASSEDFNHALKIAETALQLSTEAKNNELSTAIKDLLELIHAKKPPRRKVIL
jgi:arylsulfatase A-like enzyme